MITCKEQYNYLVNSVCGYFDRYQGKLNSIKRRRRNKILESASDTQSTASIDSVFSYKGQSIDASTTKNKNQLEIFNIPGYTYSLQLNGLQFCESKV